MNKNSNIEIKKILLSGLHNYDHPLPMVIDELLQTLLFFDDNMTTDSCNSNYIDVASQYIEAYLQLGFSYLEHKCLFDKILYKAGYSSKMITSYQKRNHIVNLNKSQIRSIIGRWPTSIHNSHTISSAIDDIIFRVSNNDIGCYNYFTAKKDGSYSALYQLTITKDYVLFSDVFQNKFYQLVKE